MRSFFPLLLGLAASAHMAMAQGGLPSSETLTYRVEWRLITAGRATLNWAYSAVPSPNYQVRFHLESVGLVSKLFKVEDDYAAMLGQNMCALSSQSNVHEGGRQREANLSIDYNSHKASYLERDRVKNAVVASQEIQTPTCVHDVIGGLYFLRTLNLEPGQSTQTPVTDGKKAVYAKVEAQQREELKTAAGTFKTIRYEIYLFDGVLYRRPAHLYVWLSDDRRRLPVQVKVKMQIATGTLTFELEKAE